MGRIQDLDNSIEQALIQAISKHHDVDPNRITILDYKYGRRFVTESSGLSVEYDVSKRAFRVTITCFDVDYDIQGTEEDFIYYLQEVDLDFLSKNLDIGYANWDDFYPSQDNTISDPKTR